MVCNALMVQLQAGSWPWPVMRWSSWQWWQRWGRPSQRRQSTWPAQWSSLLSNTCPIKQSNTKELAELAICSRAIVLLSSKVGGTTHSFWISSTLLPSLTCFTFSFSILSPKFSIFSWVQAGNSDWCSLSRVCQLTDALNYTNTWLPDFFYKYLYFYTMHRCISFLFVLYFYTALHTVSYCDSECSDSIRS